ncbi:MAG: methionine biosynthesis protein MetW [bacterium]
MPAAEPIRADLMEIAALVEPNTRVLDLGCGSGELMHYLEQAKGVTARGIEIRPGLVVQCVAKGLAVCQANIDEGLSDYADRSFDYVILSQTLHLASRPGLVVGEMLRVGRRGIVSIPNIGYWRMRIGLLCRGRVPRAGCFKEPWYNTPTGHIMTLNDFRDFCQECGIEVEQRRVVTSGNALAEAAAGFLPNLFAQLGIYVLTRRSD